VDHLRVRVKFCGMTRPEDLEAAADLGADAVGLVFVPGTPRVLSIPRAREILRELPPFVARVGVFADDDPSRIRRIREDLALTSVQLHGDETPLDCQAVGGSIIKTFKIHEGWAVSSTGPYSCHACLLEGESAGRAGGATVPFDWNRLRGGIPGRRIILAGGLMPENVEEAIRIVRPYAVDVSRGIEAAPGAKDRGKMAAFLEAVRRTST
jgi:phosphoribosylanthranilate isomerase